MILEFYGSGCQHCETMRSLVDRLRKEGVLVESYEVWGDKQNLNRLHEYDKGLCGGVPFFINPQSGKWLCGEASYEELKNISE